MERISKMPMAVILAGGRGRRLYPFTETEPKPLLPVGNCPLILRILKNLERENVEKALILTGYLGEKIEKTIGNEVGNLKITYQREETPLGSGGALLSTEKLLENRFFVISADAFGEMEYKKAFLFHLKHLEKGGIATIFSKKVTNPTKYGMMKTRKDGGILRFMEKPTFSEAESDTANMGIYLFEKRILDYIRRKEGFSDLAGEVFPLLLREHQELFAFPSKNPWSDVGNPEALLSSNMALSQNENVMGEHCRIEEGATLSSSLLLKGVTVEKGSSVASSILGNHVWIEKRCTVGKGSFLGEGCHIEEGVHLPANTVLPPFTTVKKGEEPHFLGGNPQKPLEEFFKNGCCFLPFSPDAKALLNRVASALSEALLKEEKPVYLFFSENGREEGADFAYALSSYGAHVVSMGEGFLSLASSVAARNHLPVTLFLEKKKTGSTVLWFLSENGLPLPEKELQKVREQFYKEGTVTGKGEISENGALFIKDYEEALQQNFGNLEGHSFAPMGNTPAAAFLEKILRLSGGTLSKEDPDFRLTVTPDGRRATLSDKGSLLTLDSYHLWGFLLLDEIRRGRKTVYLPYRAPETLFRLARRMGAHPVGYRILEREREEKEQSSEDFHFFHDGLFLLSKAVGILIREKKTALDVLAILPPFAAVEGSIFCSEEEKLPLLLEDAEKAGEGTRCPYAGQGEVLIFPHFEEGLSLLAEASTEEKALELLTLEKEKRRTKKKESPF